MAFFLKPVIEGLFGKGEKTKQFQNFTPDQESVLNQLLGLGQTSLPQQFSFLESLLSPGSEAEQNFSAPARRQFEEEIIPSIAERFTKDFGPGSFRSSAFGQQLGQAGAGLAENLAALRSQLAFKGIEGLQNLLGGGLKQRFTTHLQSPQPGLFQTALSNFLPILSRGLAGLSFGGRKGALTALGGGEQ